MIEGHATSRYIRTSAQKAGLVLDQIRGRDVTQALATLKFSPKMIARDIEKVLRSAIANAQQQEGFGGDVDRLFVVEVLGQSGPEHEAHSPGPDGPRVSRREAHGASDGRRRGAAGQGRRRARAEVDRRAPKAKTAKAAPETTGKADRTRQRTSH